MATGGQATSGRPSGTSVNGGLEPRTHPPAPEGPPGKLAWPGSVPILRPVTDARYLALGSYLCLASTVLLVSIAGGGQSWDDLIMTFVWGFVLLGWLGLYYAVVQRDVLAAFACAVPVGLSVLMLLVVFHPRD